MSSTQSGYGPYDVTNGFATAGTSYNLVAEGETSLTIKAGSDLIQQASASVTWNFIVYGPANQSTYVGLEGRGEIIIMNPLGDLTQDDVRTMFFSNAFHNLNEDRSSNINEHFGIGLGAYLNTNTVYTITEALSAYSIPAYNGTTDLVHASFDPTLSLSDTSGRYSIALSPASAAPEPAIWALMVGGLAMIGGMLRIANARRREAEVAGIATS